MDEETPSYGKRLKVMDSKGVTASNVAVAKWKEPPTEKEIISSSPKQV
jgi:hypothetical protein